MKCSCMAPLTMAVMVMRGFTLHPLLCSVLNNGLYLVCLCLSLKGLFVVSIVVVCELNESECVGREGVIGV